MLLALFSKPTAPPNDSFEFELDGDVHHVKLSRNRRARRYILRVDAARRAIVLTMPARGSMREAQNFVTRNEHWLRGQLARMPDAVPFADGAVIPLRGAPHLIRHDPSKGRAVRFVEPDADTLPVLAVSGDPRHLPRRLTDWLKKQARHDLNARVVVHAEALGVQPGKLSLRDPRSRWGSCAADGALSFSWRLVLAPPHVLDYVAAHEVAHLREMNHGPEFWALVAQIYPGTARAKSWLNTHGRGLHGIGASA